MDIEEENMEKLSKDIQTLKSQIVDIQNSTVIPSRLI